MFENKTKGFTLIELIAVIVVLAIILAVTVPSITGVIKSAKEKVCIIDAEMMEKAAKTYVQIEGVTIQEGKSSTISMGSLQSANYLSAVLDPEDRKTSCEGYVVVTNNDGIYLYHASLKCSNTCKSEDYDEDIDNNTSPIDLDTEEKNGDQYFEGANPNNWVKFGRMDETDKRGIMWRIIKIDDYGIKMVYEGIENGVLQPLEDGRALIDGTMGVPWDISSKNKWNAPVSLVDRLNTWLSRIYVVDLEEYISKANWKVGGVPYQDPTNLSTFLTYQDIDSTNTGGDFIGLTNYQSEIGMINAVDFMYTSDNDECTYSYKETGSDNECAYNLDGSLNNFLQKERYHYWTLNARSDSSNRAWHITNSGLIGSSLTNLSAVSVRPVLNLKTDTVFIAGTGTIDDPFILEDYMVDIWNSPTIKITGDNPVYVRQYDEYFDEKATAEDEEDGDLTNKIISTGSVDTSKPGTYEITYNVEDSDGNKAIPAIRKVIVVERDKPIITLIGNNPTYVTIYSNYEELGATAYDINYGDISEDIVISGTVDINTLGTYYITYNVTNVDGIQAPEVTRKVIVKAPTPKITLNGPNPTLVDVGTGYTELGATATDEVDGDLTSSIIKTIEKYNEATRKWVIVGSVDTSQLSSFRIKYSVTNSFGVNAFVNRTVNIVSAEGPMITYTPNTSSVSKKVHETKINVTKTKYNVDSSSFKYFTYSSTTRFNSKNFESYFRTPFRSGDTVKITGGTGYYYVYALAKDIYGNKRMKNSGSFRMDNSVPVITLKSGVSRVLLYRTYTDAGATAFDKYYDGNITNKIITTNPVNTNKEGIYSVLYEVTDSAGNKASRTRRVEVYHPLPQIFLNGGSTIKLVYGEPYNELGARATDEVDGDITSQIQTSGTVDTHREGTYTITYSVTNSSGYSATRTRTVEVTIPYPTINIIGSNPFEVRIHDSYFDQGATATDQLDGNLTSRIIKTGFVDVEVEGTYTITYSVTNNLGKTTTKERKVKVYVPKPVITILGNNPHVLYKGQTYSDAGATAMDELDGDITSLISKTGSVTTTKEGTYKIVYTVTNSEGGTQTATRNVVVKKSIIKLTLTSPNPVNLIRGEAFVEPGFTADDELDGDITNKVTIDYGGLNVNKTKNYTITYSVTNSGGDKATKTRTVSVKTGLTISLLGNKTVEVIRGTSYIDAGATAYDSVDGDITNNIVVDYGTFRPDVVGNYTFKYTITNSGGDVKTETRTVKVRDPLITLTLNGSSTVELPVGDVYFDEGATATDELLGDITYKIVSIPDINPNVVGTYYVTYEVTSSGVTKTVKRTVKVVPLPGPVITFNPNGDSIWKKENQTVVTVTEGEREVDTSSFKYLWKTNLTKPSESAFTTSFSDGTTLKTPVGVTGKYYLFVLAKDVYGNVSILGSNVFNLDNKPPVLTLKGNSVIETPVDGTYNEPGVNVVEADSGLDENGVVITSTIVPGIIGTYTVTYTATDKAGNKSASITRTVSVIEAALKDAPSEDFVPLYDASYFIGNNAANWVEFGNAADNVYDYIPLLWRIIKADDIGIKIIYEGVKNGNGTTQNGTIGKNNWDNTNNTWNRPSTIRNVLSNFYDNLNEENKDTLTSKINWCVGKINSPYSFNNLRDDNCTVMGNDLSSVGLVNAVDYILTSKDLCSGYNEASCGTNNFLKKSYSYFTINGDTTSNVAIFLVNSNGALTRDEVTKNMDIRPVINLRPDVLIISGEGTFDNPYKLNSRIPVVDTEPPVITFTPNSATGQLEGGTVGVIVTDDKTGVNPNSLKYVWTTSLSQPNVDTITNSFENGAQISVPTDLSGNYYLWVIAKDRKGNQAISKGGPYTIDNDPPVITLNGTSPIRIPIGSTYNDAGATATDNIDGNITSRIVVNSNVVPNVVGTYLVTYNVSDTAGNASETVTRTVIVYETTPPVVTFNPNGNSGYAHNASTIVTVTDNESVNPNSLKYVWTQSTAQPSEASINNSFVNGASINAPTSPSGTYYLWVIAKDNNDNVTISSSNPFYIDNQPPVITLIGSASINIFLDSIYNDAGATATDDIDGNVTSRIITTSDVNTAIEGTYTVTYNVTDNAGNAAIQIIRTVQVTSIQYTIFTFTNAGATGRLGPTQSQINSAYNGTSLAGNVTSSAGIQLWTVPYTGTYRIEVWGAQGGTGGGRAGGRGARMRGDFFLNSGTQLKILVGQVGLTNAGTAANDSGPGGGGSFVTYQNNTALIVAGGGGGGGSTAVGTDATTSVNGVSRSGIGGTNGGGGGGALNGTAGTQSTPGGTGTSCSYGAGGGGFYTRGGYNCTGNSPLISGSSFVSGGTGGIGDTARGGVDGGFGGGAGVGHRASGGGGWSGGGGDGATGGGGGGGSYNNGTNQSNTSGANSGNGKVIITYLSD